MRHFYGLATITTKGLPTLDEESQNIASDFGYPSTCFRTVARAHHGFHQSSNFILAHHRNWSTRLNSEMYGVTTQALSTAIAPPLLCRTLWLPLHLIGLSSFDQMREQIWTAKRNTDRV